MHATSVFILFFSLHVPHQGKVVLCVLLLELPDEEYTPAVYTSY